MACHSRQRAAGCGGLVPGYVTEELPEMTAIQRWFFYAETNGESGLADYKPGVDVVVGIEDQWCKAQDVEQLEHLVAQHLDTIKVLRQDNEMLRAEVAAMRQVIEVRRIEIQHLRQHVESLDVQREEALSQGFLPSHR